MTGKGKKGQNRWGRRHKSGWDKRGEAIITLPDHTSNNFEYGEGFDIWQDTCVIEPKKRQG
jgi:hypothetical protein